MQKIVDDLKSKKFDLVTKLDGLREEYLATEEKDPYKEKLFYQMKLVEQELRSDYMRALDDREEEP